MGNSESFPTIHKHTQSAINKNYLVAHSTVQGRRSSNEDCHIMDIEKGQFGIFDGHDGKHCAEYVAERIGKRVLNRIGANRNGGYVSLNDEEWKEIFVELDLQMKEEMYKTGKGYNEKKDKFSGGTTAVMTMVDAMKDRYCVTCANCGDSRAFMMRGKNVIDLSHDHKTETEEDRINAAGGRVFRNRVCLSKTSSISLGVCRGFGDFTFKRNPLLKHDQQVISVVPDLIHREVPVQHSTVDNPTILVLGCDGLFDVMSNLQVQRYISYYLQEVNLFDDKPLPIRYLRPVTDQHYMYKPFRKWSYGDRKAFFASLGGLYYNYNVLDNSTLEQLAKGKLKQHEFESRGLDLDFPVPNRAAFMDRLFNDLVPLLKKEWFRQKKFQERFNSPPRTPQEKLSHIAEQILDRAIFDHHSTDNVSIMLVVLRNEMQ